MSSSAVCSASADSASSTISKKSIALLQHPPPLRWNPGRTPPLRPKLLVHVPDFLRQLPEEVAIDGHRVKPRLIPRPRQPGRGSLPANRFRPPWEPSGFASRSAGVSTDAPASSEGNFLGLTDLGGLVVLVTTKVGPVAGLRLLGPVTARHLLGRYDLLHFGATRPFNFLESRRPQTRHERQESPRRLADPPPVEC